MMYDSMHRTQLQLSADQHRWLRHRAHERGESLAAVVRGLIDDERRRVNSGLEDPLIRHLLLDAPTEGGERSSVTTIDEDLYG